MESLVVPEADATREAGKLLEELPNLWEEADLVARRKILVTMLDGVYLDTVEEKSVVAIRPKPAFQPLFEIATTWPGSGVYLINEEPPATDEPEATNPVFVVETGERDCLKRVVWRSLTQCGYAGSMVLTEADEEGWRV